MPMKIETLETIGSLGSKTTITGAAGGAVAAFLASNVVGLLGVLVALLGMLVNYHFKRQARKLREKLENSRAELLELHKEEARARIKLMQQTGVPVVPVPSDIAAEVGTDFGSLDSELKP